MKTISKILIFVSMSLALSGCDDFLTKEQTKTNIIKSLRMRLNM